MRHQWLFLLLIVISNTDGKVFDSCCNAGKEHRLSRTSDTAINAYVAGVDALNNVVPHATGNIIIIIIIILFVQ